MEVIGFFMCITRKQHSPASYDSLDSRCACACSEAGFSGQKATVLENSNIEEQRSAVRFLWTKGLNEKNIHKEMSEATVQRKEELFEDRQSSNCTTVFPWFSIQHNA
jgi:hypothetical protein